MQKNSAIFLIFHISIENAEDICYNHFINEAAAEDILLNKSMLDKLLKDFHTISGMEVSVLDARFHTVSIAGRREDNLCSFIHRAAATTEICKGSDIEHLTLSERTEEPVSYTCPFGITEAIIPIKRNDSIIAYIIATMGIKKSGESSVYELTRAIAPSLDESRLSELISNMKKLGDEEAKAYFNQLMIIGEHIGNDSTLTDDGEESIGTLIKHYIKNNLSKKLTLSDIAFNLHCSTVTLTEHFKAEFGITIVEYLTKKRMQLSEKLLISTDLPLREVAASSGFSDVEYFSRTFKRHHGVSPATWRRENK